MTTATSLAYTSISRHYSSQENELDKRIRIQALEWLKENTNWEGETATTLLYEWIWIKTGSAVIWLDENKIELTGNCIFCICPGHLRRVEASADTTGYLISVAPEFISLSDGYQHSAFFSRQYLNEHCLSAISLDSSLQFEFDMVVSKMRWECQNQFDRKIELLKGLLNVFLIYFTRNLKESLPAVARNRETELVDGFMELLKKDYIQKKQVSDYAGRLFVTPNYLNRTVKKITGQTASYHIQQQIVREAKRKALYSATTMKEIAYYLGFDNLAHFSKFFKNSCGMSFTEFRRVSAIPQ